MILPRPWLARTGNGKIKVRPGNQGLGEVEDASFTYTYVHNERAQQSYVQGACTHNVNQTTDETLTGIGTMGANVRILEDGDGFLLIWNPPYGTMDGQVVVRGTDSVTGEGCTSPMPTNDPHPSTGPIPTASFQKRVTGTSDRLSGEETVHVEGTPPLDYVFSFELAR